MVKVYLSRHGRTWQNEYHFHSGIVPDNLDLNGMYQLSDVGEKQALVLGKYLKGVIKDLNRTIFVSSTFRRSIDSTLIASDEMGVELVEKRNFFPSRSLLENVPIEYYGEEAVRQYRNDPRFRESSRNKGIALSEEIANSVSNYFLKISKHFPEHEIIAILHKSRNSLFLRSKGIEVPRDYKLDNCGLFTLDLDEESVRSTEPYCYNKDLEQRYYENDQINLSQVPEIKKPSLTSLVSLIKEKFA